MIKHHLKLAIKVLLRRKFFTAVSLFGVGLTLTILTVSVAWIDHLVGSVPPEIHADRTLCVSQVRLRGRHASSNGTPSLDLLERTARGLPFVERTSFFSLSFNDVFIAGRKHKLEVKRTDAEYWRILAFEFLEGRPISADDVQQARPVAVISEHTRRRLFGGQRACGRYLELDEGRLQVIGVVRDVAYARFISTGEVWVPLIATRPAHGAHALGVLLARSSADIPAIRSELNARLARAELPNYKQYDRAVMRAETAVELFARDQLGFEEAEGRALRVWLLLWVCGLLFMLLPAINLVNLNASRILERTAEIGVRKAFGASRVTLVGQFIVENVILALLAGALALPLSAWILHLAGNYVLTIDVVSLNLRVFSWSLLLAVIFGGLSGAYPAWRMARLHPVAALRGGQR